MDQISKESIQEAKEKLGDRQADMIADILSLQQYNPTRHIACCPLHNDKTPSFSYNARSGSYFCFGCHRSVDIIDAWMMKGDTFLQAVDKLFQEAEMPHNFSYRGVRDSDETEFFYPDPKYSETKDNVYAYWQKRCISKETIDAMDVQESLNGDTVFQFFDSSDVLRAVKFRPSRPVPHGERKCWWLKDEKRKELKPYVGLLFNQNKLNISQPIIICTGEGDAMAAYECGFHNSSSIPGGDQNLNWVSYQWDFLTKCQQFILVYDNDDSGRKYIKEITRRLGEDRCKVVDIPETLEMPDGSVKHVKDLNELLFYGGQQAVINAINNAQERKIESVVDCSDVQDIDMEGIDGMKTGFKELDHCINKSYCGTVSIITGVPGAGKTSFLSTIINEGVDQGYPTWVYSGELSNSALRNWTIKCRAGQYWLEKVERDGFTSYQVKPEAIKRMDEYYKDRLFFFKDTYDATPDALFQSLESCVRKYGVRMAVIDNLSSVNLGSFGDEYWNAQNQFIRDCIATAKRLDIIMWVVLHPKKMVEFNRAPDLYDLSGSVSAANLAHRVFSLYRVKDDDRQPDRNGRVKPNTNCSVQLHIKKDRFTSALGRVYPLNYDPSSRRFYDSLEMLKKSYAWDTTQHNEPLPYLTEEQIRMANGDADDSDPF